MTDTAQQGLLIGDWLSWTPESIVPSPWNRHIPFFAWLFATVEPELSVELGSGSGESFRVLCQVADRFTPGGRVVGVDQWSTDHQAPRGRTEFDRLQDYCYTRHGRGASLLRLEINEAAAEFAENSIDLLHISNLGDESQSGALDLAAWAPKIRPGGVIIISSDCSESDDASRKTWKQLEEWYPATSLALPGLLGLAQTPVDATSPLVDLLGSQSRELSALFHSLGERIEYRHLISSEPLSGSGLRHYISDLMHQHAEDMRRAEARYQVAQEALETELAGAAGRVAAQVDEISALRAEIDMLMAKLAAQAAVHERRISQLQTKATDDVAHLEWKHSTEVAELVQQHLAETSALHREIARRHEYIEALTHTVSWRVTKPLRTVQSVRIKLAQRPR